MKFFLRCFPIALFCVGAIIGSNACADATSDAPLVKSTTSGSIGMISADDRKLGIAVEFQGYPDVAALLSRELMAKGYLVVTDSTKAAYQLHVTPIYFGDASDRPEFGEVEKHPELLRPNINLGLFIPGFWTGISGAASNPVTYFAEVFGKATGLDRITYGDIANQFDRTKRPQQAFISRLELLRDGKTQLAEILSESFAKDVPLAMIMADNLKLVVWFME